MGILIISIIVLLLSFYMLNEVTDRFFVPSLDKIAEKLKMSDDAAGATLMAAGSSAPELFVAIIALSSGDNFDIGIGTIVGSALFNLLVIVGTIGLVRKSTVAWQPMLRDIIFYVISIGLLYWSYSSGHISMVHVALFIGVYVLYIIAVVYWRKLLPHNEFRDDIEEEEDEDPNWKKHFRFLDFILEKLFAPEKYFGINFFISIVLIAGLSWVLVESAVHISEVLEVPKYIIGLTILAFGTSVPDMISSIIVAKQGRGGMAISNALGSNIFDILIGLGLPWLVLILMNKTGIDVNTDEISHHILVLLESVVGMLILFLITGWRVNRFVGVLMIGFYLLYLISVIFSVS